MRILLCGATGFIGTHLARQLAELGHEVSVGSRRRGAASLTSWRHVDFALARSASDWLPLLADIELVINAVGLIAETPGQSFSAVQAEGPSALFAACDRLGVRVIQISALGAEHDGELAPFLASKRMADAALQRLPVESVILHPSVVVGEGGGSTALLAMLAILPLVPLPGDGMQQLNPVHIEDFCAVVCHIVQHWPAGKKRYVIAGPERLSLRELLVLLRAWMGRRQARFLSVPMPFLQTVAMVLERLFPGGIIRRSTIAMLHAANTPAHDYFLCQPLPLSARLRQTPPSTGYVPSRLLAAFRPLLLLSLAFVWLVTGIVSIGPGYAAGESLLAQAGISAPTRPWLIYGGGTADLLLGVLLFSPRWRSVVLLLQCLLMLGYTALVSVLLPVLWLSPLGEVMKNAPMLVVTLMLFMVEPPARRVVSS